METVKFNWYKKSVPTNLWNYTYSKSPNSYTFLGENGKETWVGFMAVIPPEGCLQITDKMELGMIKKNLQMTNTHPQPRLDKEIIPLEVYSEDIDVKKLF
jgi:hypothetical protein